MAIGFISSVFLPSSVLKRSSYDFRPMFIPLFATVKHLLCKVLICVCCFAVAIVGINALTDSRGFQPLLLITEFPFYRLSGAFRS